MLVQAAVPHPTLTEYSMSHPELRMDLNLFRVLDVIYSQGGIGAEARALHLTQPAITPSLNRLRELFGDPLFVRQGNRMIPTDKPRTVMAEVQRHLKGLQATTRMQPAFRADELDREFSVGYLKELKIRETGYSALPRKCIRATGLGVQP